ncbi:hypothetical protein BSR25_1992 [Lactococcus lactis subsp. lactis bv. diacetylactis]|nr:hypothetical protein BSR25_1992 [Lactococcus lactis subsp. lactis bv. diacetylactis]
MDYVISEASQSDVAMTELMLESTLTTTVLGDKGYIGQALHHCMID